jgi:fructose-1,6-bisphosphatase/sedoheptulose 1,7-bisphosphatase-like protein
MATHLPFPKIGAPATHPALTSDSVVEAFQRSVASTAAAVFPHRSCRDPVRIDRVASRQLEKWLMHFCIDRFNVAVCEGVKDHAPMITEGMKLGQGSERPIGDLIIDPVECTTLLAQWPDGDRRGSSVIVAAVPRDSIGLRFAGGRGLKLVLPPGLSGNPDLLQMAPAHLVWEICTHTGCRPADIEVVILGGARRFWNRPFINQFKQARVAVREISAGDFEAHISAAKPRVGGKIRISYGIGGVPEGLLAVPYVLMTGATMLLQLKDPLEENKKQIDATALKRVYTASDLIHDEEGDCFVVYAGITASEIVSGIECPPATDSFEVEVVAASPRWGAERRVKIPVNIHVNIGPV